MEKQRVEAFSDGMFAIIMTIMVLELKVPEDSSPGALLHQWPVYVAYALSFANVFTSWLNHRHPFAALEHVDTRMLWSNAALLFVLSWVPFATAYAGESRWLAPLPVICIYRRDGDFLVRADPGIAALHCDTDGADRHRRTVSD